MDLIFVGGIHGSGKTVLCQALAESMGVGHYSAGRLIQDRLSLRQTAQDKVVSDVDANQRALLAAVDELRMSERTILLDGHFAVLATDGGVREIPCDVFRDLHPTALVVLDTELAEAAQRLRKRDGSSYSSSLLEKLREKEIAHATGVSEVLRVPLSVIKDDAISSAERFLRPLLGASQDWPT